MTWRPNVVLGWLAALVGSVVLGGCSSSGEGTCVVGTDGCVCFPNMTCERGLECAPATNTCTAPDSAAGGGPSGQAGSDSAVADDDIQPSGAGTPGSPTGGTGGDPTASGGSSEHTGGTTPSGGQAPTGGTTASGGQSSSGGASGSAGDAAAGGEAPAGGNSTGGTAGEAAAGGSDDESGGAAGTSSGGTTETNGGTGGAGGFGGTAGNGGQGGDAPETGGTTGTVVPVGVELIRNGSFSTGDAGWTVSGGSGTYTSNGALCVSGQGGNNPLMGWPADAANGVAMAAGTSYRLSFRFRGESTGFDVKVGGVYDPWPEAFRETELAEASATWRSSELTIEIPANWGADSDGVVVSGVAFVVWFSAGQMEFCVDDVSLMRVE